MPDETTILSLPLILPAQAQKHVTHNEALVKLDLMVQLAVINRTLSVPPALPTIGDRHIVATGATGAWAGQAGRIALYTQAGWQFTQPLAGWQAYVIAESQMAFFNGLAWIALSDGPFTVGRLGVSATPDATNRLAVSSPATLLNHAGSGHQLKLNKAAVSDTASLLFQTGFGGRAEMGTSGSDDFSVKVSQDGSSWSVALEADAATGEVTLPQPLHLGGQAADPVAPVDGTVWLNTTTGEVKVRSAGVTQVVGGSSGGVVDGDKGDITVSGTGASWTIDAGSVSLSKMADLASGTILGRATSGTGSPEALTAAQVRTVLNVADGATANQTDAFLLDRANHTGTQAASTVSGLAAVATSGSAADLTAGTLPAARFDDTAHGSRAGGALHAAATTSANGFMSAADKTKLDGVATGANNYVHPNHTGDVTSTGDGATTIAADAVTNAKLANMAANTIKANATAAAADPADLAVGTNTVVGRVGGNIVAAQLVDGQIAAATITNAKLANVATATLKGRVTAGSGAPEDLTATQATSILDLFTSGAKGLAPASGGGTTNFLRADGTWAAPPGGGGISDGDKGDITVSGAGASWTIDAGVVSLAKMSDLQTARFIGRSTAGTGTPEALTGTEATALLDQFTSGAKGLAPASGGGTTNFLRADGTWAAPAGGGGSPGGATGQIQYNNAGAFAGAADVEVEGGQLRLPAIASPTAPSAGGVKLYGAARPGGVSPVLMGEDGLEFDPTWNFMRDDVSFVQATYGTNTLFAMGAATTVISTITAKNYADTDTYTRSPGVEYLVGTATTSAIAALRFTVARFQVGGSAAGRGGFRSFQKGSTATGSNTATHRFFMGLWTATAPTDVNPSTLTNICGIGHDAADTNLQFLHNDGAGAATKIDLGANFPKPTAARSSLWSLEMYSPPGTTQELHYRVQNHYNGQVATGVVTTNLPATSTSLTPHIWSSVGGTSSVIGVNFNKFAIMSLGRA